MNYTEKQFESTRSPENGICKHGFDYPTPCCPKNIIEEDYTTKRLEEFDEKFHHIDANEDCGDNMVIIDKEEMIRYGLESVKSFLSTSIHQAEQEMLKRVVGEIEKKFTTGVRDSIIKLIKQMKMNQYTTNQPIGSTVSNNPIKNSICELHREKTCNNCEKDGTWTFEGLEDCAEIMWGIICNVSEGDWTKQNKEWQDAVIKCREYYFRIK